MIYLFDKNLELIENGIIKRNDVISSWQVKEINGLIPHTIEFKYSEVADTAEYFGLKDPDFRERFWVYKIVDREKTDNPNGVMKLKGIHKFFDDLKGRGYVQDLRPDNSNFGEYMDEVLEGTGWVRGGSAVTSTVSGSLYYISKAEAFWKLIESAGCEFELTVTFSNGVISEQRIDFSDQFAVDNGRLYVHGDKLLNVVASTSDEFIPTAFLPRGKGVETEGGGYGRKLLITDVNWSTSLGNPVDKPLGSPILELKDRTAIYGYADGTPRLQVVEFPDIADAEELARAVYQYALDNSRQKFQYKANVFEDGYISTGELVSILSRKINVVYKVRIFKVERNFLNAKMKRIELGDKIIQSRAEQAIQAKRDEDRKEAVYISLLNEVRNEITQDWWNTDGYNYQLEAGNEYGLPGGIYSFNAPIDQNPNELVGISAGKLVIAHKDDSGNWQVLTGADGKGIHGDSIVTNSITANKLAADVGQSLDLSSNVSITQTVKSETQSYIDENKDQLKGADGNTPYVEDGYWFINGTNTGVKAEGQDGAKGADGAPGKDGIGITSTTIEYAVNQSGTTHPTTGWSGTVPNTNPGDYIWTKTTWNYTDNTSEEAYSVGRIGADGPDGNDGLPGAPGVGIKMTTITYTKSNSGTVIPPSTATWSPTPPAGNPGEFIWTRTVWTYTDNTTEAGYSVGKIGNAGPTGPKGPQGAKGADGKDGATPYIGANGNWWINGIDTGVEADVAPIREEFESYRTQTDKAIKDRVTKTEYSGLTTRVAQAEQKLTPTAITQTVENNTTALATKAEVQTTAENWTAKFSQIGGKNLLYASNVPVSSTSYFITSYDMEEEWQPNTEYTVTIKGTLRGTGARKWGILGVTTSAGAHISGETSFTFTTPSSLSITIPKTLQLYNYPNTGVGPSTVEWIKLEKGSISTGYDQHPSELYTGITTINKDGVTVGREGETIETNLGFDGVRITDGATEIASFTGSGAVINNLEAESISGDVINIMSSSMTFDIGSGTGYYADFSQVLEAIGNRKHLANGVKITINIRSVLNETISIEGFSGGGSIEVNIYSRVNGSIRTSSNSCAIMVYGKNTTHVVSWSGYPVVSSADAYVLFDGLNIDAKNATGAPGISSQQGSNVYVRNCDMANCQDALHAASAGKLHALDTRGNVSRYAAIGYQGSIWLGGTVPDGDNTWFVYTFGNVRRTPSSFSPPPTTTVTETRTFNHTDIYTYSVQYGAKSTHYGKAAAQNRWDTSMTQMKGRIVFGSSVYNFISGRNSGTTPTVKMRLRRQNSSHGASASVKPTPEWSGAPSFGGATRGNWTPWVTIPYTLFTSSGYTFSFYNGTTGSSYAIWDRAEIQITRRVTQ